MSSLGVVRRGEGRRTSSRTGIGRTVDPAHTSVDGDAAFVLAAGPHHVDPLVLAAVLPHVVAAAIRDGVRSATTLYDCPAIS